MANEENGNNLAEVQNGEEIVEPVVSKMSELSGRFVPKLSTILEEETVPDGYRANERFELLSRPKTHHLQETLSKYGQHFKSKDVQRIQMQIRERRGTIPMQKQAIEEAGVKRGSSKSHEIYQKLQAKLRRVAFDALTNKMFEKLPELILSMERQASEPLPSDTKCLLETLRSTLIYRLGEPMNDHEDRMFQHICFGLTKFVENIIESVRQNQPQVETESKTC
ncbi:uncharacterized protein LOC131284431 [Anopheles ziemanni]|uniref:uncharacterized protein LOC131271798 n=1 Tax=Anopheles coustani TaxID=139045 RepID=UPI002658F8A0|nr:uncharacterized protein LOC131271798 [Anopheles coustani]XP_058169272.1 uncharacterized protein LOC131284431 [Anopheles ziemanni]